MQTILVMESLSTYLKELLNVNIMAWVSIKYHAVRTQ